MSCVYSVCNVTLGLIYIFISPSGSTSKQWKKKKQKKQKKKKKSTVNERTQLN